MNIVGLARLRQLTATRRRAPQRAGQVIQPAPAVPAVQDAARSGDLPYVEQRVAVQAQHVDGFASDLDLQRRPYVGFHLTGCCPWCGHPSSDMFAVRAQVFHHGDPVGRIRLLIPITTGWWRLRRLRGNGLPSPTEMVRIGLQNCRCVQNHPGSDGKFGCGASWLVQSSFDLKRRAQAVKFTAVDAEKQAQYWPPADAFATAVRNCLDDVQASAGKWQTGLTAVLGLVGAVALIGGRDSLSKIGPEARVWIVTLAAVALVANLAAIGLATLSNVGLPKMARIKGPEALINADLAPLRQTRRAIDYLRWAILTAAAAFFATIAAVIVLWLAPDANPTPTTVSLTVTTGDSYVTVCGTLATDQPTDGQHVALVRSSPSEIDTYPLSSISKVEPGGC